LTLTSGVVIGHLDLHHTNYADNIIDAVADGVNGDTGAGFIAAGGVKWVPSLLAVFDICF
jgi:hypothetical protein